MPRTAALPDIGRLHTFSNKRGLESFMAPITFSAASEAVIVNSVSSLWLMVAAALVLIMTPGVAFFYGGMVKAKSVISMMMMSFGAIALVTVLWVLYGYSMSFSSGKDWIIPHVIANPLANPGLSVFLTSGPGHTLDLHGFAFAGFQATFAIITVALISGAIADRAKFGSWMVFAGLWVTLVYFPVASWVFNFTVGTGPHGYSDGGWSVYGLGVNDFAGGTAVHINAGAAGLALAIVLGRRVGFAKGMVKPHNVPLTLLGASLLWFGWFGFNAGSEGASDGVSALAWINTLAAPAAATLGWLIVEKIKDGKATSIGAASGAVSGLVAITPACNILTPGWGMLLGAITGAVCALAIDLKWRLGFDDSLDVVGVHFVGGWIGTLYIGIFGTGIGWIESGSPYQLWAQFLGAAGVTVYSFFTAAGLGWIIQKTIGFRITSEEEVAGVDNTVHGEEGYLLDEPEALRV